MDLRELYQEVILDHNKSPRNFGKLDSCSHSADGYNPLCGDRVTIEILLDGDIVKDLRFTGSGCAISTASASMLTEAVIGKRLEEVKQLFDQFHEMVTGDPKDLEDLDPELGKLSVFAGVCEFPTRVKCATLAWHTLQLAIDENAENGAAATSE